MSIKVIKGLSVWKNFLSHNVFDGVIVRDDNNIVVLLIIFFENLLNFFYSFPHIEIALSKIFEFHELDDLFLFFLIGKMDKVVEMLEVKFLIFLIIIFDEPEISFFNQAIKVIFGEFFLFVTDSFTDV